MANKINNWKVLLELVNHDIMKLGYTISVYHAEDSDGRWYVDIDSDTSSTENYAEECMEEELGDLINDAWAHVRARGKKMLKNLLRLTSS